MLKVAIMLLSPPKYFISIEIKRSAIVLVENFFVGTVFSDLIFNREKRNTFSQELEVCTLVMFFTGTNEAITGNTKLKISDKKPGTFKSEKKLWPIFVGKEWLQTEIDDTEINEQLPLTK